MSSTDEEMLLRVSDIVHDSIVDGPGLRLVVFTQGCPHNCTGCHNPSTHSLRGGTMMNIGDIWAELQANPLTMGLTISGGEPFLQPTPLAWLAEKARLKGLSVWVYTGYLYENLINKEDSLSLLKQTDVLVDGPFISALKTYDMEWRGSTNQRLIDVQASLKKNALYEIGRGD